MRLVADTNVVVSGLIWGGVPSRILDAASEMRCTLFTSAALIAELEGVLRRPKFERRIKLRRSSPDQLLQRYMQLTTIIDPIQIEPVIDRDPADDRVLEAAIGAAADLIVSGDAHLLDLGRYRGIKIVRAGEAVARINC